MSSDSLATIPQSPVNITTFDTPTQSFDTVLESNYQSAPIEIFNNGKNIDGEFETQQNYVTYRGERYDLKGFHFHTQSEHTFDGQNTSGEIHLVHESSTGKKLVVGILLEVVDPKSSDDNLIDPQLNSILGKLDVSLQATNTIIDGGNFNPGLLISDDARVYNYGGSLTTKPFTDATWVLAADTLKVNASALQNFSNLQNTLYANGGLNNREIQNELFLGTNGDDFLQGDRNGASKDLIYARDGNDIVDGGQNNDKLFGEAGEDTMFGGRGDDLLVGDIDIVGVNSDSYTKDYLIGGEGQDLLYIYGDDIAVGGGSNSFNSNLIETLDDEPWQSELNLSDGQQDTFVFVTKGDGYTATIVGFEAGIDRLDLRQYNLGSVDSPH